jgi:hypothetical protein
MNKVLPIGSVVMLNGGTKPVMIFGYLQESAMYPNQIIDYIGVPYPEGSISLEVQIGFNMKDIKEIIFEGYRNEEFRPWEELLSARNK